MPGLGTTDDRTLVGRSQAIDRTIINPWFMVSGFLGTLVLYLGAFVLTIAVHLTLNDALVGPLERRTHHRHDRCRRLPRLEPRARGPPVRLT